MVVLRSGEERTDPSKDRLKEGVGRRSLKKRKEMTMYPAWSKGKRTGTTRKKRGGERSRDERNRDRDRAKPKE